MIFLRPVPHVQATSLIIFSLNCGLSAFSPQDILKIFKNVHELPAFRFTKLDEDIYVAKFSFPPYVGAEDTYFLNLEPLGKNLLLAGKNCLYLFQVHRRPSFYLVTYPDHKSFRRRDSSRMPGQGNRFGQ